MGKYDSAIVKINKAIAMEPNLPRGYNDRGFFYLTLKNTYDQINNETHQLKEQQTYLTTEKVLKEAGMDSIYWKILDDFSTAIKLDSNYWEAYDDRGEVLEKLGRKKEALEDYKKLLELAPNIKRHTEPEIKRLESEIKYKEEFDAPCNIDKEKIEGLKTGRFKFEGIPEEQAYVERKTDTQTGYVPGQKIKITLDVKWISDCEYHLTYKKVNQKDLEGNIGKVIKAKIVEVMADTYRAVLEFEGGYNSITYEKIK